MSFFMMPSHQQVPNVAYPPEAFHPQPNYYNNRPQYHKVLHPKRNETQIPFNVYDFDRRKFDQHKAQLNNASNILRFEIDATSGRSLNLFDRVLREHLIDMNTFNLYYLDDENDLVAFSTERDFLFMIKLMKGKLTKIICETKSVQHPTISFRTQIPTQSASFGSQCPLFGYSTKRVETKQQEQPIESLIDKALSSVFSFESPKQAQTRTEVFFPRSQYVGYVQHQEPIRKEAPRTRTIEINLADLLGIPRSKESAPVNPEKKDQEPKKKEQSNDQKKDQEPAQSFRDFLVQRLKERYPVEQTKRNSTTN